MKLNRLIPVLALLLTPNTIFSQEFILSPDSLQAEVNKGIPMLELLQVEAMTAQLKDLQRLEQLQPRLEGQAFYEKTSERSFATFIPVTSPITTTQLKVIKPTAQGVNLGAFTFSEQITNDFVNKGVTTGFGIEVGVDLYNDFLGNRTQATLESSALEKQKSELQTQIQSHIVGLEIQKLYWALVANNESIELSNKLLESSKQQVLDARERLRNNVSDRGEVARYESQLATRKANITSLEYQRASMIRQLKELIPSIAEKNVVLGPYDADQALMTVLACTNTISSFSSAPISYSPYQKLLEIITQDLEYKKKISRVYDRPDVRLNSQLRRIGKREGFSNALDELTDSGRTAFQVGLQVSIPLGAKKSRSREVIENIDQLREAAQVREINAKMSAYHTQVLHSIDLLNQIMTNQKINSEQLTISLREAQRKYQQARISVNDLINDQDAFLQSGLNEIQTKLTIINTILDYFTVFTSTPCELNRS
jgi:hypothetical protein